MTKIVTADTRELTVSSSRPRLLIAALALVVTIGVTVNVQAGSLPLQWNAPTTNADGSALADLANYRLYLGTSTPTCPSASFHLVSSPTSTPAAGEIVASRIIGLSAGTTYYARVTAVDTTGNESGCSASASGSARADFAVTPTTSTSFGSIMVGTTADRTFTVQNTSLESLSGSVSAGAPFTILAGGTFSLAPGASHTATVGFAPTAAGSFAGNVNVTAGGDSVSRAVSGSAATSTVTLSVTKSGTGTGTVASSPAGIDCGAVCTGAMAPGTVMTLTAVAGTDSAFTGWSNACSGAASTCTWTMSGSTVVTATFDSVRVDRPQRQASVPVARSIAPSSAAEGSTDLTLTLKGKNFVTGSAVRWNGDARPTTFVNGTQLRVAITAADLVAAGSATVDVVSPGGGTSQSLTFTITPGAGR